MDNVSYSHQWIRNDGTNDVDMAGQTGSTYTLAASDQGKTIKAQVSLTDEGGNSETLTSAATAAVAARPPPLTVSLENSPASHNGTDALTFDLAFSENIKAGLRPDSRPSVHRERREDHQGATQDPGQQPFLNHHGPAQRKRRRQHHAARDDGPRRHWRHLQPRRTRPVRFHVDFDRRPGMSTGRRRTRTGGHRIPAGPLDLDCTGEELPLSVSDDGIGLPEDHEAREHGFRNMRADAERMGGRLQVKSDGNGGGTTVTCVVPYRTLEGRE